MSSHTTIICLSILICILSLYLLYKSSEQEFYYFSRRRRGGRGGGGRGVFSSMRGSGSRRGFSGSRGGHRGSFGRSGHRGRGNRIYNNYYGGGGGYGYPYLYNVPAYYYDDYYTDNYADDDWCWSKVTTTEANLSENASKKDWSNWAINQGIKRILFPKDITVGNFIMKQSISNCMSIDINNYDSVIL